VSATAFVFPGQNSHFVGMAKDLWEAGGPARAVLERADAVLGFSLTSLMFDGPEDELTATHNQQPAILTHSAACLAALESYPAPGMVAGHSLGEYSALLAAGCLTFGEALRLVRRRGELMAAAGGGAMAAIIGLEAAVVEDACAAAREVGFVGIANYNCPGQVVITGEPAAVAQASDRLKESGAKRVVPLRVSGAFHSPLMAPAAEELRSVLAAAPFTDARMPLVGNVDAEPRTDGGGIRDALGRQMTSPVRWEASIRRMVAAGVTCFVEVGPGRVVTGLIRRSAPEVDTATLGTVEELGTLSL